MKLLEDVSWYAAAPSPLGEEQIVPVYKDRPLCSPIIGDRLHATITIDNRIVFITEDTSYFCDYVNVYLVDDSGNILDHFATGCVELSCGYIRALELLPPNSFRFGFYGEMAYRVVVHQQQRWRLPMIAAFHDINFPWWPPRGFLQVLWEDRPEPSKTPRQP